MTTQHITLNQTLTPHFTLAEFVRSGVAIRHNIANTPTPNAINNLRLLCENVLEPLRRRFGVIRITSGYRCEELNNMVGGKPNSQHLLGQAADIHLSNKEVAMKMFNFVAERLDYDQLLFEHRKSDGANWLHVSYNAAGNRKIKSELDVLALTTPKTQPQTRRAGWERANACPARPRYFPFKPSLYKHYT